MLQKSVTMLRFQKKSVTEKKPKKGVKTGKVGPNTAKSLIFCLKKAICYNVTLISLNFYNNKNIYRKFMK